MEHIWWSCSMFNGGHRYMFITFMNCRGGYFSQTSKMWVCCGCCWKKQDGPFQFHDVCFKLSPSQRTHRNHSGVSFLTSHLVKTDSLLLPLCNAHMHVHFSCHTWFVLLLLLCDLNYLWWCVYKQQARFCILDLKLQCVKYDQNFS